MKSVGNKVVSFIGDSLSRQSFGVLLEAIQTPPQVCTYAKLKHGGNSAFPTECALINGTTNITFRMHNEKYGDNITKTYFQEADIIVFNFGVWYVEQQGASDQPYSKHLCFKHDSTSGQHRIIEKASPIDRISFHH